MGMLQIGDKHIREENIAYIEIVSKYYDDLLKKDPNDFYNERLPKIEVKVARIHLVGGGEPIEISGEKGLAIVADYLKANPGKKQV
jgi:hypothetical protein